MSHITPSSDTGLTILRYPTSGVSSAEKRLRILLIDDTGEGRDLPKLFDESVSNPKETARKIVTVNEYKIDVCVDHLSLVNERFSNIWASTFRRAHAVVFVCDMTDMRSFQALDDIDRQVKRNSENPDRFLIATQCDRICRRVVEEKSLKEWAETHNMKALMEVSAVTGVNVQEAYSLIIQQVADRLYPKKPSVPEVAPVTSQTWQCTLL